jgi:hypothetical protein
MWRSAPPPPSPRPPASDVMMRNTYVKSLVSLLGPSYVKCTSHTLEKCTNHTKATHTRQSSHQEPLAFRLPACLPSYLAASAQGTHKCLNPECLFRHLQAGRESQASPTRVCHRNPLPYLTESVYNVVLQKSISTQIRRLILSISKVDDFVEESTF